MFTKSSGQIKSRYQLIEECKILFTINEISGLLHKCLFNKFETFNTEDLAIKFGSVIL